MIDDPNMLMSMVNMKLRDGNYTDLADFCASEGYDEEALVEKLAKAGFEYFPEHKKFI